MTRRRLFALYAAFVCLFGIVLCRVLWISTDADYAVRAGAQTTSTTALPRERGDFFDRKDRKSVV